MFYQLPPAGNPVCLSVHSDASLPDVFSSSHTRFYASGTAALAAAVASVLLADVDGKVRKSSVADAEIILPAYGCPDLVSAVIFAGAKPVLVDLQADRPWLDLGKLAEAININTVAIVGVNLFGISERWTQLRALAEQENVILIEDSAQYFPGNDELVDWQGDLVVFSFGRGKPVSLLGGGAVYARKEVLYKRLLEARSSSAGTMQKITYYLKARLYNAMILPHLYWLPQSMPFLHLGETRYHALPEIGVMDSVRKSLLSANTLRYQNDNKAAQSSDKISNRLDSVANVTDLAVICGMPSERRLLRFPILVDAGARDELYQKLKQAGLGASIMYPASMPEIEGLEPFFAGQSFPQAEAFASKLLTLPVHAQVSDQDIEKMAKFLEFV